MYVYTEWGSKPTTTGNPTKSILIIKYCVKILKIQNYFFTKIDQLKIKLFFSR